MGKKTISLFLIFWFLWGLLFAPPIKAENNAFQNMTVSVNLNYNFDLDGNCVIYSTFRYTNEESDFNWTPDNRKKVSIYMISFSKETAKVRMAGSSDYYDLNYLPVDRKDGSYLHIIPIDLGIETTEFMRKGHRRAFSLESTINQASFFKGDCYYLHIPGIPVSGDTTDISIRVILPYDRYNWSKTLTVIPPTYKTRIVHGNEESFEWVFDNNYDWTDHIVIYYQILEDIHLKSLDEATTISKNLGWGALIIAFFTLLLTIYFEWEKIKETRKKIRSKYRETKEVISLLRNKLKKESEEENRGVRKKRALPRKKR